MQANDKSLSNFTSLFYLHLLLKAIDIALLSHNISWCRPESLTLPIAKLGPFKSIEHLGPVHTAAVCSD